MTEQTFEIDGLMGAILSHDRHHRYWLWRIWDRSLPLLVVCMFNPSTANERDDDPTVTRLCGWARRWGYGGILIVNLHSLRSSDPVTIKLRGQIDGGATWGPAQAIALGHAIDIAAQQRSPILAAWGALADPADVEPFRQAAQGVELICLGRTANGSPTHPMARGKHRVPDDQQPIAFELAA
jgi:hypothetical protein